jgi:hypothetical protein
MLGSGVSPDGNHARLRIERTVQGITHALAPSCAWKDADILDILALLSRCISLGSRILVQRLPAKDFLDYRQRRVVTSSCQLVIVEA